MKIPSNQNCKESILAIAQELVRRADEISSNNEFVSSIVISAVLTPETIANFDVTKNYAARFDEESVKKKELHENIKGNETNDKAAVEKR